MNYRQIIIISVLFVFALSCTNDKSIRDEKKDIKTDVYACVPLQPDLSTSLQTKWENKKILKENVVDHMESLDKWQGRAFIPGNNKNVPRENAFVDFSLSDLYAFEGSHSIKLKTPTRLPSPMQSDQRMWDWIFLTREFNDEDFTDYTRISAKIYPDCPGHKKIHLFMILQNGDNVPDKYLREGLHTVMLENNKWNDVIFEVPHLKRDQVKSISFVYRQQGNEIDASDTVAFYIDRLAWQQAETEHFEGWDTADDIVFSHTGYNLDDSKTAFTSASEGNRFKVLSVPGNEVILEKDIKSVEGAVGKFSEFDFTEINKEGLYRIQYNNKTTEPFPIKNDVWNTTLLKTMNFFFSERCGYELPGIHGVCHSDCYTLNNQDTVFMNGGWHDAGDLSQSFANTAEATGTMFRLARNFKANDSELSKRLLDEAMWGLKWLHKNRFADGQKVSWTVIDHWSDGLVGNSDDKITSFRFNERDNRNSIVAEVEAMKTLKDSNPDLAKKCLEFAMEDWHWNEEKVHSADLAVLARGVWAGATLYEVTKSEEVKNKIIGYADELMKCQQKEPMDWNIPLNGFFYTNSKSDILFVQRHVVSLISPILGLVQLCQLFPQHENYQEWHTSIKLYAEYLKATSSVTDPYNVIPASVYKLGSTDNDQIVNGIAMNDQYYLRMFPVWEAGRGNSPVILSYAVGLAEANKVLKEEEIEKICQSQLEWIVGKNPFNQSLMYGEGYNYSPQFSAPCGDIVGGIPVGIQTKGNKDIPYWQPAVLYNFKELWVHVSARWLYLLESMYYSEKEEI